MTWACAAAIVVLFGALASMSNDDADAQATEAIVRHLGRDEYATVAALNRLNGDPALQLAIYVEMHTDSRSK